jgi:hypothetical protein
MGLEVVYFSFVGWGETEATWYQSRMIDEYRAFGGMRIGRGKPKYSKETCHIVHHKSHMT